MKLLVQAFEAAGDVDAVAERREPGIAAADAAQDGGTHVDAQSHAQTACQRRLELRIEALERVQHVARRKERIAAAGTPRRSDAEQGHDAVAEELVDGAAVT